MEGGAGNQVYGFLGGLNSNTYWMCMKPYIINVDRSHPIGAIIADYGDYQWLWGHISGLCVGGLVAWLLLAKK